MLAGICTSLLAIVALFISVPTAHIVEHHITYSVDLPGWIYFFSTFLYLIATITPFFIPHIPNLWLIGVIAATSYSISFIFYHTALLSVWCFFAALLSLLIFIIVGKKS
jgi:hypothetical protein